MGSAFQWADFWKKHLESDGRFEVYESVWNAEAMQKAWALENRVAYKKESWQEDILIAQVREFRPDIFFPHGAGTLSSSFSARVRQEFPKIIICGYDGVARNDTKIFAPMDIMFSCLESSVGFYRSSGYKAEYFKLGYEDSINHQLVERPPRFDCSFVGGLFLGTNGHQQRLKFLSSVSARMDVRFHIKATSFSAYLRSRARQLLDGNLRAALVEPWFDAPRLHRLTRILHPGIYGLEMLQLLRDSRTTLNIHIDAAGESAANMRLFEATGTGSCLVTDWKPNLKNFFKMDEEVVCFKTVDECVEKCKYLICNEKEREKIARAGQKRTLTSHRLRDSILNAGEFILGHCKGLN